MDSLSDFPCLYSHGFKLSEQLSDEKLQDVCNMISDRIKNLVQPSPKVSVVFPAFNEEMYLPLMLWTLSKLATSTPIEIIGVNNASTDRTGEIVEQCGITRIDEKRKGVSYARQAGLENARGQIIATTDADTQVPETWVDANMQYFEDDSDLACISGGTVCKLHYSHKILKTIPQVIRIICGKEKDKRYVSFGGANTFFRKSTAMEIGGYEPGFNLGEDNLIAQRISKKGKIAGIKDANATVYTSDRRMNSTKKVIQMYLHNLFRVNWLDRTQDLVTKAYNFSDIR